MDYEIANKLKFFKVNNFLLNYKFKNGGTK